MLTIDSKEIIVVAWQSVGKGLWVNVYSLRGNSRNTLAIDLGDSQLAVVSPGIEVDGSDLNELDKLGTVKALVSPGSYHNLGLSAWSARYPDATLYGPKSAVAYIAKEHGSLKPLLDFEALASVLPDDVRFTEMTDMKHADALVIITRADGVTWFTNECITNENQLRSSRFVALLFRLTGSTPGLNVNTFSLRLVGGKKKSLRACILAALESDPPTRLIPCHGEVLDDPELASRMREMIERRLA